MHFYTYYEYAFSFGTVLNHPFPSATADRLEYFYDTPEDRRFRLQRVYLAYFRYLDLRVTTTFLCA